jgi:cytoskeleton protein RodZ
VWKYKIICILLGCCSPFLFIILINVSLLISVKSKAMNQDQYVVRTEPSMFVDHQRKKPDGKKDPAGEVGFFLQRERECRGLSVEEAGDATGIHPYHIEAIEFGDMTHMPQRMEALEMIAAYAQYLGFDADPLVEHMLAFLPPPPVARKYHHPASPDILSSAKVLAFGKMPKVPELKIRLAQYPGGIVASVLGAFLLLSTANWMFASEPEAPLATEQVVEAPVAVDTMPTASTGQDVADVKVQEAPADSAIAATDDADVLGNFIQDQVDAPASTKPKKIANIATGDVGTTAEGRVYGAGNEEARIVLKAKAPVWLRIEDAKGNVVMTQMLSTGDTYRVPNRDGLIALSRDGGRLAYMIDGQEKGVLGPVGQILVGEKLDVVALEAKI